MKIFWIFAALIVGTTLVSLPLVIPTTDSRQTEDSPAVRTIPAEKAVPGSVRGLPTPQPIESEEPSAATEDFAGGKTVELSESEESIPSVDPLPQAEIDRLAEGLQAQRMLVQVEQTVRELPIDHFADLQGLLEKAGELKRIMSEYDDAQILLSLDNGSHWHRYVENGDVDRDLSVVAELNDYVQHEVAQHQAAEEAARKAAAEALLIPIPFEKESVQVQQCFVVVDAGMIVAASATSPSAIGASIKRIEELPVGAGFKVIEVLSQPTGPWLAVQAYDTEGTDTWSGWIDSTTLHVSRLIRHRQMEPKPPTEEAELTEGQRPTIVDELTRRAVEKGKALEKENEDPTALTPSENPRSESPGGPKWTSPEVPEDD